MNGVARIAATAVALGALAVAAVGPAWQDPVEWTPDSLFYQERVLELRGATDEQARATVFGGPLSAELRARDPGRTGDPAWVEYNEPFYERRVAVPLAAAAAYPLAGERTLLYLSLTGYVAAVLALFGLLLLRFRLPLAAALAAGASLLPPLLEHSSSPLTDSWGLALLAAALAAATLALERGPRWLLLWVPAIALLAFTRDSAWIPVLAAGWCAVRYRTRVAAALAATGAAAALPALLLFRTPVRELLALLVNDSEPSADTSWGFIVSHYPGALVELLRANAGFIRRGEWTTAAYLAGVVFLLVLAWRRRPVEPATALLCAAAVAGLGYVLAAPVFSAFRLELVLVPPAAYGLGLAAVAAAGRLRARQADAAAVSTPG